MEEWLSKDLVLYLFILSAVGFVGSLIAIPLFLIRLPPDYFEEHRPRLWMGDAHPALRLMGMIMKNVVGAVLLAAGLLMLFLPGQGVITMLVGVSLLDFPGKRTLERKMIQQRAVLRTINKLREKFNRPPLTVTARES